ncbi:hypothetical protein D3OALGA1CA_5882 [Olavius algarvensis associated proteobacterium Delta 3]|nr:hypothetical protein D3OALGA1CA_5882 [Olavius algarvensis associated proteobacterium Delta 3]
MIDTKTLCEKIITIYPEIGECGIEVRVEYDEAEEFVVVYLEKAHYTVKHFLPKEDAEACLKGKQCVALGLEIAQFKDHNFKEKQVV